MTDSIDSTATTRPLSASREIIAARHIHQGDLIHGMDGDDAREFAFFRAGDRAITEATLAVAEQIRILNLGVLSLLELDTMDNEGEARAAGLRAMMRQGLGL